MTDRYREPGDQDFSLDDLAGRTDLPPRTIRYYISEGLLPPPLTTGRNARYGEEHLDRLTLIRSLKDTLTLREIREHLALLDSDAIRLQAESMGNGPAPGSSSDVYSRLPNHDAAPASKPADDQRNWRRVSVSDQAELTIDEQTYLRHRRRITHIVDLFRDLLND